jgi:hypothetical protein
MDIVLVSLQAISVLIDRVPVKPRSACNTYSNYYLYREVIRTI